MTQHPAEGERYYYESIKSDALSLEDEYEVDFRGLMDAEYNKLCVEQKTCTVNCAMVREAWQRLMLEAPVALAAAAEQLRAVMEANEKLQAENKELEKARKGLARIYEVNEAFHWRLVDLFDPTVRGVSALHYLEEQIKLLQAENDARFQMQADRDAARAENDSLRKQLSDQADEISMLNAEAEMWQQRAEIAEAKLNQGGRP